MPRMLTDDEIIPVLAALAEHGSQSAAARALGMDRATFRHRQQVGLLRGLQAPQPHARVATALLPAVTEALMASPEPATGSSGDRVARLEAMLRRQGDLLERLLRGERVEEPVRAVAAPEAPRRRAMDDSKRERQLWLSDMHAPYQHPDLLDWVKELINYYKFDYFGCLGDEWDNHAISFHDSDPDLPSAADEWGRARAFTDALERLIPELDLVDSNHGSLVARKGHAAGLPRRATRSYREILFADLDREGLPSFQDSRGAGWRWQEELVMDMPNGQVLVVRHDAGSNAALYARQNGCNVIGGHFHGSGKVEWSEMSGGRGLRWAVNGGSLIDPGALAFAYGKNFRVKPCIATPIVIDWTPVLVPLERDRHGRWTGRILKL